MRGHPLRVIAGKEFRDHLRSRRFLILFGILLIIVLTGLVAGMVKYQNDLDDYNEARVEVSGEELRIGTIDTEPSPLSAFNQMSTLIGTLGAVLGIAMGFDLVTKEKESKSLKLLLSHPVYRDEVITGKALGGAAAIALAMAIVLVLALAVLLVFGVVPSFEETVRIFIFGALSFMTIFSFFILALFFSTVTPNTGSALVSAFIVFITLSSLTSLIISTPALTLLIGDYPTGPPRSDRMLSPEEQIEKDRLWEEYRTQKIAHEQKRQAVGDMLSLLSPDKNYQKLTGAVTAPHVSEDDHRTLADLFGMLAGHIVVFFVFPAAFFGLAWVRFAREDIR